MKPTNNPKDENKPHAPGRGGDKQHQETDYSPDEKTPGSPGPKKMV